MRHVHTHFTEIRKAVKESISRFKELKKESSSLHKY